MYLVHITLNTGNARRSSRTEVSPPAVEAAAKTIGAALASGDQEPVGVPDYTATATSKGKALLVTAWQGPAPLVTVGVALTSLSGAGLWRAMHKSIDGLATRADSPPAPPWIAARIEPSVMHAVEALDWLGDWERCIGWAWVDHHRGLAHDRR